MEGIIRRLNEAKVRYLLLGGQALRLGGMPRFSMDWDLYIPPKDKENIARINAALSDVLDLPLVELGPKGENFIQTYQTAEGILQFHLGGIGFPPFDEAEKCRVIRRLEGGTPVNCMCPEHLLQGKEAANRPQDQADITFLQIQLENRRKSSPSADKGK